MTRRTWSEPTTWVRGVAVVAVLYAATPAVAQDSFRQTVVVTAAVTPVDLASASRAVTVVTREQIEALPLRSVSDLLRLVASVDVRSRGDRGMQTDFAIRGGTFGQALVLVDGVRLNDTQSGHHNGDIPVPLGSIERVEVLQGAGTSLFGADALAGAINIITRREAPDALTIEGGSFGLVAMRGQASFGPSVRPRSLAGSFERSSGFMTERQYAAGAIAAKTTLGANGVLSLSHTSKDFGANGFYGPAPSHEWTHQTLLTASMDPVRIKGWSLRGVASYRTHADHFVFDVRRPALSDNRHRSHTLLGTVTATRPLPGQGSLAVGGEAASDWLHSSNLGSRALNKVSGFGEVRYRLGPSLHVDSSLRLDRYDEFGASLSPAAGASLWLHRTTRARASVGRAVRVPTFTERYYRDPANLARAEVGPERSWTLDAGLDVFLPTGWVLQGGGFMRRDRDVIDWLRSTPTDVWRTYNVHRARAVGIEASARRTWDSGAFAQVAYTGTVVSADTLSSLCGTPTCLSKYVLDYAPHVVAGSAVVPVVWGLRLAPRIEIKQRRRNAIDSTYALLDLRIARRLGVHEVRIDGANLGDVAYQEIAGVAMPGRAVTLAVALNVR